MSQAEQDEFKRAMVVIAHPDDAEFGSAGTVARWVNEGLEVTYVLTTDGSKGSDEAHMTSVELIELRRKEQLDAAHVLGVKHVEFLGFPDAYLEPTLELRKAITRMIRKYRPDRLITMTPYRSFVGNSYLNHPDHLATGEATLASVYPTARDRLTFPELVSEGLEPWKVREVYVTGTDSPDCWIDIGETIDTKISALRCHVSQIGDMDQVEKWMKERAAEIGKEHGMQYAEAFKLFKLG